MWGHFFEEVGVLLNFGIHRIFKGEVAEILRERLECFFRKINLWVRPWFRGENRITTTVPKERNEGKTEKYTELVHYGKRILITKMQLYFCQNTSAFNRQKNLLPRAYIIHYPFFLTG